jgi:hypothetical protein
MSFLTAKRVSNALAVKTRKESAMHWRLNVSDALSVRTKPFDSF